MADENPGFEEAVAKMMRDAERMTSSIMTGDDKVDRHLTAMLEICQEHFGQPLESAEHSVRGYVNLIEVMSARAGMTSQRFAKEAPAVQKYLYLGFAAGIITADNAQKRIAELRRKRANEAKGDDDAS